MIGARVERGKAEAFRKEIASLGLVDKTHAIIEDGPDVVVPLTDRPDERILRIFQAIIGDRSFPERKRRKNPIDKILETVAVPDQLKPALPRKWELFGDVLVLRLHMSLDGYENAIAEAYSQVLGAKTVMRDVGGISGEYRKPLLRKLIGEDTVTVYIENGVKYRFDVAELMFSSGNVEERARMGELECDGETVVDMFAGIGYFSLPLAVHRKPKEVIACELNPIAHSYLLDNIRMNRVEGIVKPVLGDNRRLPGSDFSDRVIMGYVKTTHEYLPTALRLLKSGGILHYHETCPNELVRQRPVQRITESAKGFKIVVERLKEIKSYAPGISHVVVDARIFKPG